MFSTKMATSIFSKAQPHKCDFFRVKNMSSVAFIGIGNMGSRMVNNLIKKGEKVVVYDVSSENAKAVKNAEVASSVKEAVRNSSTVITMLPNGDDVKKTILSEDGILNHVPPNALIIDSSTIEPKVAQELSQSVKAKKIDFIDAPVSGGIVGAADGTLTFMVGGEETVCEKAKPLLLKMGKNVYHCGGPGAGQVAKLCNNLILGITMLGTCEGMNLGIKMGLDPKKLASIVNVSTGRSWSSEIYNPVPGIVENIPSSKNYAGGFMCKLVAKDLALAQQTALNCGAPLLMGANASQIYRLLMAKGFADKDFAVFYDFLKNTTA